MRTEIKIFKDGQTKIKGIVCRVEFNGDSNGVAYFIQYKHHGFFDIDDIRLLHDINALMIWPKFKYAPTFKPISIRSPFIS